MKLTRYKLGEILNITRGASLIGEFYATDCEYLFTACKRRLTVCGLKFTLFLEW